MRWRSTFCPVSMMLVSAIMSQTLAQDSDPQQRAARLSFVEGSVSVLGAGSGDWVVAPVNRPVTVGDQLWSDRNSRAELQLGGVAIRLSSNSEVSMLAMTDEGLQVAVDTGIVNVALRSADATMWYEIDTPQAAISLLWDGDYRILVDRDGATTVSVQSGRAQLTSRSGGNLTLRDGQGAQFPADGSLDIAEPRLADAFDRWCAQRDAQWERGSADVATYVSSDVPGTEQLSDAGEWINEPDTGEMWFPQVGAQWAPYQSGRWLWTTTLGWTWLDRAPWGFAPFHYGQWKQIGGRWGWIPPSPNAHPTFAAALVAAPRPVTESSPSASAGARVTVPLIATTHRSIIATRSPNAPPNNLPRSLPGNLPSVVVTHSTAAAPAPGTPIQYASPIGPTIYARDVPTSVRTGMTPSLLPQQDSQRYEPPAPSREIPMRQAATPAPRAAPPPPKAAPESSRSSEPRSPAHSAELIR